MISLPWREINNHNSQNLLFSPASITITKGVCAQLIGYFSVGAGKQVWNSIAEHVAFIAGISKDIWNIKTCPEHLYY